MFDQPVDDLGPVVSVVAFEGLGVFDAAGFLIVQALPNQRLPKHLLNFGLSLMESIEDCLARFCFRPSSLKRLACSSISSFVRGLI